MIKIGITGALASGKSTVAKLISEKKYPIFSADTVVKKLYTKKLFIKQFKKNFNFKGNVNLKKQIKIFIALSKKNIEKIESFVHPFVRKELKKFSKKRNKKLIYEIPLLFESNLIKYFDIVVFVAARKNVRLSRYVERGGHKSLFRILNNRQIKTSKKAKLSDFVVNNNKSLLMLKKNVRLLKKKI